MNSIIGALPTALNVSQRYSNTGMLDIHWAFGGNVYCIQSSAHPRLHEIWNIVTNGSYTLPLIDITYDLIISPHPEIYKSSNFTIGKHSSGVLVQK